MPDAELLFESLVARKDSGLMWSGHKRGLLCMSDMDSRAKALPLTRCI